MSFTAIDLSNGKVAYSIADLVSMGLGSQSHIRRKVLEGEIPHVKLGKRWLIPAYWVHDIFLKPESF